LLFPSLYRNLLPKRSTPFFRIKKFPEPKKNSYAQLLGDLSHCPNSFEFTSWIATIDAKKNFETGRIRPQFCAMAKYLRVEIRDHVAKLTLDRPPLNALNMDFIEELNDAVLNLEENSECWGLIIDSASEAFFSNGLDPEAIISMDVAGRQEIFARFLKFSRNLYAFSKPSVAVVAGHAMAGGAVIGILTDFRFLAEGRYAYCFSEVRVGLTIPQILIDVIEKTTGPRYLRQIGMLAERFRPEECLKIGLADAIYPGDRVQVEAEKYLRAMFDLPLASIRSVKTNLRAPIVTKFDAYLANPDSRFAEFLTGNFIEGLTSIVERRKPVFSNP